MKINFCHSIINISSNWPYKSNYIYHKLHLTDIYLFEAHTNKYEVMNYFFINNFHENISSYLKQTPSDIEQACNCH